MGATSIASPNASTSTPGSGISGLVLVTMRQQHEPDGHHERREHQVAPRPIAIGEPPEPRGEKNITRLIGTKTSDARAGE